jgi:Uma2 family endonuclease
MRAGGGRVRQRSVEDLLEIPDELRSHELLDGELIEREPPSVSDGIVEFGLLAFLAPFRRFGGPGGDAGWAFAVSPELALGPNDVCRPLLAGWRRARLVDAPDAALWRVVPDFVVEVAGSPRDATQEYRRAAYHRVGVPHLWIVDPQARHLHVLRCGEKSYESIQSAWGDERVFAEPFDVLELIVSDLFGEDDDSVD